MKIVQASDQSIEGATDGEADGDELGWLVGSADGDADGIAWARMALQMVAEHGHSKAFETILSEMEQITKGDA